MFCRTSVSRSSKNSWEKRGDPTVVPSKQKPSVNSTGIVFVLLMGFFLTENLAMVASISSASDGLTSAKRGMIDVPSVEVRMRVLCTFRIRRRGAATSQMVVHVNLRSTKGMVPHTLSTKLEVYERDGTAYIVNPGKKVSDGAHAVIAEVPILKPRLGTFLQQLFQQLEHAV